MIIDIYNEVFTKLKTELSPVATLSAYNEDDPVIPCVVFEEMSNDTVLETVDTSGEFHNELSFEVNIFTTTSEKTTKSKELRKIVDSVLSDYYGMNRDYSGSIPAFLDNNLYRYTLRYSCKVDKNYKLYRR